MMKKSFKFPMKTEKKTSVFSRKWKLKIKKSPKNWGHHFRLLHTHIHKEIDDTIFIKKT